MELNKLNENIHPWHLVYETVTMKEPETPSVDQIPDITKEHVDQIFKQGCQMPKFTAKDRN